MDPESAARTGILLALNVLGLWLLVWLGVFDGIVEAARAVIGVAVGTAAP